MPGLLLGINHRLPLPTRKQTGLGPGVFCHTKGVQETTIILLSSVLLYRKQKTKRPKRLWGGSLTLVTEAALEALKSEKDRETE